MESATGAKLNRLVAHIRSHEIQLWKLIDAQHELKSQIACLGIYSATHPIPQLLESLECIMAVYEGRMWQIAPIQLQIRMNLLALDAIAAMPDIKHENNDEEMDGGIEWESSLAPIDAPECILHSTMTDTEHEADGAPTKANSVPCGKSGGIESAPAPHSDITADKPFKCNLCDERFTTRAGVSMHRRLHDSGTCRLCQVIQPKMLLAKHFREFHPGAKPHACAECSTEFDKAALLHQHRAQVHGAEYPFACDICPKRFADKSRLDKHIRVVHTVHTVHTAHTRSRFLCNECGKGLQSRVALEDHLRSHTGERPYACTICESKFRYVHCLRAHMASHSNPHAFQCAECTKTFSSAKYLQQHSRVHADRQSLACSFCDKTYKSRSTLKIHLNTHTGAKPFACPNCNERFANNSQRRVHVFRVHDGLPLQCTICEKRLIDNQALKAHMLQHTGDKPLACDQCDLRFATASGLNDHRKINHSDRPPELECDVCKRIFHRRSALRRHKRTHMGVKPYSCDVCHKAFSDSYTVTIHMRGHTGELPFSCEECGMCFRERRLLNKHKTTSHAAS